MEFIVVDICKHTVAKRIVILVPFSPPVLFPSLQGTVGKSSLKTNHAD